MMAIAAVIGLTAGKGLRRSSLYYSDHSERLFCSRGHTSCHHRPSTKNVIYCKKSSNYSPNYVSKRKKQSVKAVKEHVDVASSHSDMEPSVKMFKQLQNESCNEEDSLEVLLLLQKSMLEKQWNLSAEETLKTSPQNEKNTKKKRQIICSGTTARGRRMDTRKKVLIPKATPNSAIKRLRSVISPELLKNRLKGYVNGVVSQELLTHAEVVQLSKQIKLGLYLEEQKSRLKERLGCEPSDDQLAVSLKMSRADVRSTVLECSLAREKLAMSNVRLVMSIAQRYDSPGVEMADLIQGGLIGLLRGIEKFDHSRGFKMSTYVYWWIRQGVTKALVENSQTIRLPMHLHERLSLIRNAKIKLKGKGISPSIDKIAECLNMSQKKVRNAIEASRRVFSLDREAFPSLNGLPGETHHSYIADDSPENNTWHVVVKRALKGEVNNLISSTLGERESDIIRLYYGLDNECLTWEDISRRIGLSRERVRQVGLVAFEKLKHAARKRQLDALLIKE